MLEINLFKVMFDLYDTFVAFGNLAKDFLFQTITIDLTNVPGFMIDWMALESLVLEFSLITMLGSGVLPVLIILYLVKEFVPIA